MTKTKVGNADNNDHNERCPHCGYCPHCGRSNPQPQPLRWYPVYPQPYYPTWYGTSGTASGTVTSSPNITYTY